MALELIDLVLDRVLEVAYNTNAPEIPQMATSDLEIPQKDTPKSPGTGLQPPSLSSVPYLSWEGRGRGYPVTLGTPCTDKVTYNSA